MTDTRWNGEPCTATRVTVTVADSSDFPAYWARDIVGQRRPAVRVEYGHDVFYLDDGDGSGWHKVTHGGGPGLPHRSLSIELGSEEPMTEQPTRLVAPTFTPEQQAELARSIGALNKAFRDVVAAMQPAVREAGRRLAELHAALKEAGLLDEDGQPAARRDRPAWQSPYGPPTGRNRR